MLHKKLTNVFVIGFGMLICLCACNAPEVQICMFSNIAECNNIDFVKAPEAEITIYDTPAKDENLKKLEYDAFFGCLYSSNDVSFELFAYEFYSTEAAVTYFENTTGKVGTVPISYSSSTGMISYRRIVTNENMAYTVRCKPEDKEMVLGFINSWFSVDITDEVMIPPQNT